MSKKNKTIGVLLMAYGSPERLDQVEDYLLDVREGRQPSPELVEEIAARYAHVGGKSPLLERTQEQAEALVSELNRRHSRNGVQFKPYVGMRHWEPRISDAVNAMLASGIERAVSMVMAPHNSSMSIGKYYTVLDQASVEAQISFERVESWHAHAGFLDAVSEKIEIGLEKFGDVKPYVIFTAHSLPTKILKMGDPYDAQLNETASLLAERFEIEGGRWQFCYQSAGANAIPWLGPQIEEVVVTCSESGEENLLIVPIGFVCDHIEVLFDIDVEAKQIAEELGIRLERSPSLNASTTFINALADIVEEYLEK